MPNKSHQLLLSFLILFLVLTGQVISTNTTYAAHLSTPTANQCLQASPTLDPSTLSATQLRDYGLPDRPPHTKDLTSWLQTANSIKNEQHICNPTLSASDQLWLQTHSIHSKHISPTTALTPKSACGATVALRHECDNIAHAGNVAYGSYHSYTQVQATWHLPCMSNVNTINNGQASAWTGLGGEPNDIDHWWLVQSGIDVRIDSSQRVSYIGWVESTLTADYITPFSLAQASCGTAITVTISDAGSDYFTMSDGTRNYTNRPPWPTSDGETAECIVERLPNGTSGWLIFVDFNYIAFTGCKVDSNPIKNDPTYYMNMVDPNGNRIAYTGPIAANGADYNVYWQQVGCTC